MLTIGSFKVISCISTVPKLCSKIYEIMRLKPLSTNNTSTYKVNFRLFIPKSFEKPQKL